MANKHKLKRSLSSQDIDKLTFFRRKEALALLNKMMDAQIYSKKAREKWYNMCKSLYRHSINNHFDKCSKIIKLHMPQWWKENIKVPDYNLYVNEQYFIYEEDQLDKISAMYVQGEHLKQKIRKSFLTNFINGVYKITTYISRQINPYLGMTIWTILRYIFDYIVICNSLKILPMNRLPFYHNDIANFGYTVILTLSFMQMREKFTKWIMKLVREQHLGAEEVALNDPYRVMKIRVKNEVKVIYNAMISSKKIKRNQTLENLEIMNIECQDSEEKEDEIFTRKVRKMLLQNKGKNQIDLDFSIIHENKEDEDIWDYIDKQHQEQIEDEEKQLNKNPQVAKN